MLQWLSSNSLKIIRVYKDEEKREPKYTIGTSLVAQTVKSPSTMQKTRVRALGWENPLEKEMAIHSSTIA